MGKKKKAISGGSRWDIDPYVPIIGTVAGGVIDAVTQERANRATSRDVQNQIDFQREQNATAYQRAVADMQAAGINPALAYSQGGAGSGSGAAAEYKPATQNTAAKITAAIDSYNNLSTGTAQRQLIREQANKTRVEAEAIRPAAILGQNTQFIQENVWRAIAEARGGRATAENIPTAINLANKATTQTTATAKSQERLLGTQATLNEQEFMNEWFKKNIAPYLTSTAKAIRSIKGK